MTDDDRSLYLVNADFDRALASEWVRANVLSHLECPDVPAPVPFAEFGPQIAAFVADVCGDRKPQFAMWSGAYDFVLLAACFGTMLQRAAGRPKYFLDLRELAGRLGSPHVPRTQPHEHDAQYNARHDRDAYRYLAELERTRADRAERRLREHLLAEITSVLRPPVREHE